MSVDFLAQRSAVSEIFARELGIPEAAFWECPCVGTRGGRCGNFIAYGRGKRGILWVMSSYISAADVYDEDLAKNTMTASMTAVGVENDEDLRVLLEAAAKQHANADGLAGLRDVLAPLVPRAERPS